MASTDKESELFAFFSSKKAYVDPHRINPDDCSMTPSVRRFDYHSFYAIAGRDLVVSGSNAD